MLKTEKREQIRAAAYRCFVKRGYHETSVDDICKAAKISKGSYYWYYESKQQVFLDIVEDWATVVEQELRIRFRDALATDAPYSQLTSALGDAARRHRRMLPVWMDLVGHSNREPEVRKGLKRFHDRIRDTLAELFRPLLGVAIAEDDLRALCGSMLGCFIGLVLQDLVDPDESSFDKQVRIFMNTLERLVQQARFGRRTPVETAQ